MPAWKAEKLIASNKSDQVDLDGLGEATGILFETRELLRDAVQYLESLREKKTEGDVGSDARDPTDSTPSTDAQQDKSGAVGSTDPEGKKKTNPVLPEGAFEGLKSSRSACASSKSGAALPSTASKDSVQKMPLHLRSIVTLKRRQKMYKNLMRIG